MYWTFNLVCNLLFFLFWIVRNIYWIKTYCSEPCISRYTTKVRGHALPTASRYIRRSRYRVPPTTPVCHAIQRRSCYCRWIDFFKSSNNNAYTDVLNDFLSVLVGSDRSLSQRREVHFIIVHWKGPRMLMVYICMRILTACQIRWYNLYCVPKIVAVGVQSSN